MSGSSDKKQQQHNNNSNSNHHLGVVKKPMIVSGATVPQHLSDTAAAASPPSTITRRASMNMTTRPDFSKVSSSSPHSGGNTSTTAGAGATAVQLNMSSAAAFTATTSATTKTKVMKNNIMQPGNQQDKPTIKNQQHLNQKTLSKFSANKETMAALLSTQTKKGTVMMSASAIATTVGMIGTRTTAMEGNSSNSYTSTANVTTGKRRRPSLSPFSTEYKNASDAGDYDIDYSTSQKQQRQLSPKRTASIKSLDRRFGKTSTSSQIRRHNSINFDNLIGYTSGSDSNSLSGGGLSSGNSFANLQNSTFAPIGGAGGSRGAGSVGLMKRRTHRRMNSANSNSNGMGSGEAPKLSAFPFSAPRFTPEDERKELESMTDEEKQQAIDDMRGTTTKTKLVETSTMIEKGINELQQELQQLSSPEKIVYEEALEKCPAVVERECEPIRFLRAEQFNAKKAAERICSYWVYRKKIFGPIKAFQPMTLSGSMSEDLEAIITRWDFSYLLPPDEKGRTVFYMDRSRFAYASEGISNLGLLRLLWYVCHVALEKEVTQKNGVVLVIMFKLPSHAHFDRKTAKANFGSFRDALPVRVQAVHMLHMPEYMRHLFPVIKNLMGKYMRARMRIHNGSGYSVLSTLSGEFSLLPKNLPASAGGEYQHDPLNFVAERERIEGLAVGTAAAMVYQGAATEPLKKENQSNTTTETMPMEKESPENETPQVVVVVEKNAVKDSEEKDVEVS